MITEAMIRAARFPPELIPDSWAGTVPANAEVTPPLLDLKNFRPNIITLSNIQLLANANAELRARYDGNRVNENTAAMLNAQVGAWRLMAKDTLYLNFFGLALIAIPPYSAHYGLWVIKPTDAHKIAYGITLNKEEMERAQRLGISDSVEKGVLPLPLRLQVEREYLVLEEETHARSVNIAAANTTYTIESIYPRTNEIVVLTRIASNPGLAGPPPQNIHFIVDRDTDAGHADVATFPLSLVPGGEVECFIPALKELKLTCTASVAPGWHLFRYTFQRVKLNNILRVRFGLVSKDEVPGDVYDKVMAGVL